jgi:hypothetical protein
MFTNGPWKSLDGREHPELAGYVVLGADGVIVADCNIFGCGDARPEEVCRDNARLIAAAPDLLQACRNIVQGVERYIKLYTDEQLTGGIASAARCAKEAISKVEGK